MYLVLTFIAKCIKIKPKEIENKKKATQRALQI